jgi:hypothetical protein
VAHKTRVKLDVFDSEGKIVKTLLEDEKDAGTYKIELSASSLPGRGLHLPEASYVYRLQAGDYVASKKMVVRRD